MTEKRFGHYEHLGNYRLCKPIYTKFNLSRYANPNDLSDVIDENGKMLNKDVINLLNELAEDNDKLIKRRGALETKNVLLREENEKLIQKKCLPCELVNLQTREIDKLKDENEQLRQVVEEYRETNKHLSELCADASKNGYLPPWRFLR